ncbi:MAG: hypothetical protein JNM57_17015 [Cyclobacteriaceae bacterium]|nr:hypothetical protein [Cyclobacteriaceae bacterium]
MNTIKKSLLLLLLVSLISVSCGDDEGSDSSASGDELTSLPADTGGTHTPKVLGSTTAAVGYYVYLPAGYDKVSSKYPLLVFLHGKTERGDGTNGQAVLDKVLANGPPKLIKNKQWNPPYPMIVVSPQYHDPAGNQNNWGGGSPAPLKAFIEHMISTYRVNEKRIYLTGLSHGGNGVYDYLTKQDESTSHIAAAAPVAAYGAGSGFQKSKSIPIWVFIGDKDGVNFTTSKNFVTNYNAQSPTPKHQAKISVFDAGHDVWTRTYSGSGMGTADTSYDPFSVSLYSWMLDQKKD